MLRRWPRFSACRPAAASSRGTRFRTSRRRSSRRRRTLHSAATEDPAFAKCLLPGVPRATYMPYPFEIIQNPNLIGIRYAFARAVRTIDLAGRSRAWLDGWPDFWMGDSRGKWDGDTLVVDVRKLDERTWFDHAGNFHSDAFARGRALFAASTAITFSTKRRLRIPTCSRGPGRSACRSIASSTGTSKYSSGTVGSIRTAKNTRTPSRSRRGPQCTRPVAVRLGPRAPSGCVTEPLESAALQTSPRQSGH